MRLTDILRRLSPRRFARSSEGIAAVEFAIILPMMLTIALGGYDVMRMVRAADKVETTAKTMADLTAQESTSQSNPVSDIQNYVVASQVAAAQFNDPNLTITVSAVDLVLRNNGTVCCDAYVRWSLTQNGTARSCKTSTSAPLTQVGPNDTWTPATIPKSIASQGIVLVNKVQNYATSVIVTDVSYNYTGVSPGISNIVNKVIWRHAYSIPRTSGQVLISSAPTTSNGQSGCLSTAP